MSSTTIGFDQLMQLGAQGLQSTAEHLEIPHQTSSFMTLIDGILKGINHLDAINAQSFFEKQASAYEKIFWNIREYAAAFSEKKFHWHRQQSP